MKFEKLKALKNQSTEDSMFIVQYLRRWWNFYMKEDEKKEIEPIFTEKYF